MTQHIRVQHAQQALFPDVLWNRPVSKQGAGKLLIVGGNKYRFYAPAQAQMAAEAIGAGHIRVLMPDAVKQLIGSREYNEYAPSNPSGSFASSTLDTLMSLSAWSDGVLLAGDAGHNSESTLLVETYLDRFTGMVTITHDFLDMFTHNAETILNRHYTLLVASFSQLQKIAKNSEYTEPFTYAMPLHSCLEQLCDVSKSYAAYIITYHHNHLIVAVNGEVAYMKAKKDIWRVEQAATSAVMWMQQPETPFETLTTSLLDSAVINSVD